MHFLPRSTSLLLALAGWLTTAIGPVPAGQLLAAPTTAKPAIAKKPIAKAAQPPVKPFYPDLSGAGRPSNRGRAGSRGGCQAADVPFVMAADDRQDITTQAQPSFLVYLPSTASRFTEIRATISSPGYREVIALPVPADRSRIVRLSPQIRRPLRLNQTYNWQLSFYCGQASGQVSSPANSPSKGSAIASASPSAKPSATPSVQPSVQPSASPSTKPSLAALPIAKPTAAPVAVRSIGQTSRPSSPLAKPEPTGGAKRPTLQAVEPTAAAPENQAIVLEGTIQRRVPSAELRQALAAAKTDRDRYLAYAAYGSWLDTAQALHPLRCIAQPDPTLEQSWQRLLAREKLSDFAAFPAGHCKVLGGKTSP
jgi:hypothetical protein